MIFAGHIELPGNDNPDTMLSPVNEHGCVFLPMVLQVLQDYASFSPLQNYASLILTTEIHLTFPRIRAGIQLVIARSITDMEFIGQRYPTVSSLAFVFLNRLMYCACAGYMGYPLGTLRVNLFRYLV